MGRIVFGLFVLIGLAIIFNSGGEKDNSSKTTTAEKKTAEPPPPTPPPGAEVSQAFFKYIEHEVGFDCGQRIKRLVTYDIRTPGVLYGTSSGDWALMRFTRYSKFVAADGAILLAGDDAEAQNRYGGWVRVNYSCTVNVMTKQIVDAGLDPGKL